MTAIVGFAGPGYGLLAIDRNIVGRDPQGRERVLSREGGKLHAGPDGWFAGSGKANLLAAVARRVAVTTEPAAVARAMRVERKSRYARKLNTVAETSFGVLMRRPPATGPELFVLRPEEGYRPLPVPPGRPLVTGPEDPAMRPLIGAFRLLFAPTPGAEALSRNLDLLHLYFWLRRDLDPSISADFDLAVATAATSEMRTESNRFSRDPAGARAIGQYLEELAQGFQGLARLVEQARSRHGSEKA